MREQCDISKVANPVTFLKWGDTGKVPADAEEAVWYTGTYTRAVSMRPLSRLFSQ